MYKEQEDIFYYITVMNEQYEMPPMPEGSRDGILKGMYQLRAAENAKAKLKAQLLGSGAILNEVLAAQKLLEKYDVAADVWSVTSYQELYRDGHACDRWNMLHPGEQAKKPYVTQCLENAPGVFVAASDYLKVLPDSIDQWMPRRVRSLGTDGFGRSERSRVAAPALRGRRPLRRARHARRAGARRPARSQGRRAGDQGPRDRSREERTGKGVDVQRATS